MRTTSEFALRSGAWFCLTGAKVLWNEWKYADFARNISYSRAPQAFYVIISSKSIAPQIIVFSLRVTFVLTCSVVNCCSTEQKFNWWKATAVMLSLAALLSTQLHAEYWFEAPTHFGKDNMICT